MLVKSQRAHGAETILQSSEGGKSGNVTEDLTKHCIIEILQCFKAQSTSSFHYTGTAEEDP